MDRRMIIDFCNTEIFPRVRFPEAFDMNCKEVIKMVIAWRRANGFPQTMTARVENHFLYLNDKPVGRIAPAIARTKYDERAYYYEGRILARQELF